MKKTQTIDKLNTKEIWVLIIAAVTIVAVVITATVSEAATHQSKDCCETATSTMSKPSSQHQHH